ncbi:hypothetical protein pb186bvf_019157 [Paramecium bursaria]
MGMCKPSSIPSNVIFAEIKVKIIGQDESTTFVIENISKPYINGFVQREEFNYVTFCFQNLKFNIYEFKGKNNLQNFQAYPETDALIFIYESSYSSSFMDLYKQIIYLEIHAECKILIFLSGYQEEESIVEVQAKLKINQIHHIQRIDLVSGQVMQDSEFQKSESKFVENSKLPSTQNKQHIIEHYSNINDIIDKMNRTIVRILKYKDQEFKGTIKKQIDEAQDQVQVLSLQTSEEELQRKLQIKRQEIEQQRQLILQSSMEFSNKCNDYKRSLEKVMTTTQDLMSEVSFLDNQIRHAQITNQQLQSQLDQMRGKIINQVYQTEKDSNNDQEIISGDFEGTNEQYGLAQKEYEKVRKAQNNITNIRQDNVYEETQVEKIFIECVNKVKQLKKQTDIQKLLQSSKNPKQQLLPIQSLKQFQKMSEEVQKKDNFFSDIELTDLHKRMIFDEFLSRNEIKALIYNLL